MGPVIFLMGPTASGKTEAACRLVDRFPCDIVSVDSALVYRGLDIGTAKPGPATLARYPHRLIDVCDPTERYSAARFREDALRAIDEIHGRGRVPLLVGGTGLYFKVLAGGIAALPSGDAAVRERLAGELARSDVREMHRRLALVDPVSAARIHPNDQQRTLRALEVCDITGAAMSALIANDTGAGQPFIPLQLVYAPTDRSWLHRRIERRFDAMLRAGFINEVRALRARGDLGPDDPALRAVGYRAAWQYLDSQCDFATMREQGIVATRQLAKRQFTWFRRVPEAQWVDPLASGAAEILNVAVKRHIEVK